MEYKLKIQRLKLDKSKRILCISDIHGGIHLLKELLHENLIYPDSDLSVYERKANIATGYQRLIDAMLMEELNQIVI